ncbi:Estradiol 17-beta-dehydrogenase 8 [Geodia barretti]|uniref:(3R)-3-hydroxyacyl-CoA dehydrogenase n=1 Tax=Geodia barretti TaxID=519541 RepID=A0AA35TM25_GEOBA|nr:Estradiol 17-beta-dehydrogenase 8 [Geodia barretti]
MSLASRLALVTGGGTGIGRAVCQQLAREGASVAVAGNNLSDCEETVSTIRAESGSFDASFHPVEVDVSDSHQVSRLFSSIASKFTGGPQLSAVVNAAGITRDKNLLKMTEQAYDEVIKINLKGTFLVSQAAARLMVEHSVTNGSIVNIASITGKLGNFGQANYSASKGGVMSMTLTFARELGRHGIRCNAILPGFISTQMTDAIPEPVREQIKQFVSLGRFGRPEEVAELVAFLASDRSSYITGSLIDINGGLSY